MGDMGDDFRALAEHNRVEKEKRIARFYDRTMPAIKEWIKKYDDALVLEEKSDNHYRIKNLDTGKFVDFWHTRAMMKIDKTTTGMGYKEKNLYAELELLLEL